MTEICASAPTVLTIATRRAVSTSPRPWAVATSRASVLYCRITFAVQNRAVDLSPAFGFVLEPSALISLNAVTHWLLPRDGGGGGRNWSPLCRMKGRTFATHGVCGAKYAPGVRRHTPGPGVSVGNDDVEPIGVTRPSPSRSAISLAAVRSPYPIPTSFF